MTLPKIRRLLQGEPQLTALIERFGADEVWFASVEILGCPPTWGLGVESLSKVYEYLETTKRERV